MNKKQILSQAHKSDNSFNLYASYAYSETSADPIITNISYHLTEEDAVEVAENMELEVGFESLVSKLIIDVDEFRNYVDNNYDDDDEVQLDEVAKLACDKVHLRFVKYNDGGDLPEDGVIVWYKHHRYINYAYDICGVKLVSESGLKTFAQLINEPYDTFTTCAEFFDNIDNLIECYKRRYYIFGKINSGDNFIQNFINHYSNKPIF
jgi:hypothetical protein